MLLKVSECSRLTSGYFAASQTISKKALLQRRQSTRGCPFPLYDKMRCNQQLPGQLSEPRRRQQIDGWCLKRISRDPLAIKGIGRKLLVPLPAQPKWP